VLCVVENDFSRLTGVCLINLFQFIYFIQPFLMFFFLLHARLRNAHASTAQIAVLLQSNYE